jgi:hypothetical protein
MIGSHDTTALVHRCAALALGGVRREYPNKIAHVLQDDRDVRPPRKLTPIFHGCFDWHSAVHSHWLLARACRIVPDGSFVAESRQLMDEAFTREKVACEVAYLSGPGRESFERPYGLAWLLQLCAELRGWEDPAARRWASRLEPLETLAAERFLQWLPRLPAPIRTGEHSQTAFAMGLVLDWARVAGRETLEGLVSRTARAFHLHDAGWSLAFEPGGQDFLSPGLAEADLLRRVLDPPAFAQWLERFLPELSNPLGAQHLQPVEVTDRSDGKLVHLDGLNLSRTWMLEGIVEGLPEGDPRRPWLDSAAHLHAAAGLAALDHDDYETTHWLGTFASRWSPRWRRRVLRLEQGLRACHSAGGHRGRLVYGRSGEGGYLERGLRPLGGAKTPASCGLVEVAFGNPHPRRPAGGASMSGGMLVARVGLDGPPWSWGPPAQRRTTDPNDPSVAWSLSRSVASPAPHSLSPSVPQSLSINCTSKDSVASRSGRLS